jgi:glycosyltransferase involved in cell wall biosynthesis
MRILVISPIFPPMADSEAFCGGKFVQELIHFGYEPLVILCTNTRTSTRLDSSRCWKSLEKVSIDLPKRRIPSTIRLCWFALRYRSSSWSGWTRTVVSQAQTFHRRYPFDLVVSRSMPWHAHLAGYWVSSTLRLPWIANVNDPWDISPFVTNDAERRKWKPNLNVNLWWRRLVAGADAITFPCERLRDHCLKDSRRQSGVFVVPHIGYSCERVECEREFRIVHTGKLGLDDITGRSARPLLEGLEGFLRKRPAARALARLVFVGSLNVDTMQLADDLELANNVSSVGVVNYEESLQHIAQACVCVLVEGNFKEGIFLPSKLCDYIAARKPILALSPEVGTVNDLASEGGIRRVSPNDSIRVTEALIDLFDAFLTKRLDTCAPPEALVQRFDGRKVTGDFLSAVAHFALASRLASSYPKTSLMSKRAQAI